ncbi:MAG: hypothetical protein JJU11_02470 [Candidatus Sumerlaeia bacterium]|nr:hypothetical protein [Candidatus Sumerlaeia bacterium]
MSSFDPSILINIHWLGTITVVLLLSAILFWGFRRDRKGEVMAKREIAADDPPFDPISEEILTGNLAATMIEDRRFLRSLWGPDTPDLLVGFWRAPRDATPRHSSFRQLFLPLADDWEVVLAVLEREIFEAAEEQGVPMGSLLDNSWCFLRLPGSSDDVAIQTRFIEGEFHHSYYLVDPDGKLHATRRSKLPLGNGGGWASYRGAIIQSLHGNDPIQAREEFHQVAGELDLRGAAHGWLALLAHEEGGAAPNWRNHLSVSRELAPENLHARLLKARFQGGERVAMEVRRLDKILLANTDHRIQTGFLLAQSLHALDHHHAARGVCQLILAEAPRHSATSRLIHMIDQRERGAQT